MTTLPSASPAAELTAWIRRRAGELEFSNVGCCAADAAPSPAWERFVAWLEAGYAGEMQYLAERRDAYRHPSSVLNSARSVVMLTMDYRTEEPAACAPGQGRVSRYAWGPADYHDVIHARLKQLVAEIQARRPDARARGVVDTAPLLEREFARAAGLGWIGKHTLLLNRQQGSWFFLAALLLDVELTYDAPFQADHCGTCRACLDACPTQAFPEPYVLDATRCISYLTIELRGEIPRELRAGLGEWVFGCDICQDVCPWNRRVPATQFAPFRPRADLNPLELCELFELDDASFRAQFRESPIWRPKRRGLLRNAAVVLGNQLAAARGGAEPWTIPVMAALQLGLRDAEPVVRSACVWALAQFQTLATRLLLAEHRTYETDAEVRATIDRELAEPRPE